MTQPGETDNYNVLDHINAIIKHTNNNLIDYSAKLLETQEMDRNRISRDLHDSTVQNLTSLVHKSELCMKLMEVDQIRCKLELSSMGKILREIINDTRKLIYDLRPMSFDDIGFDVTLERSLDKFKQANNVHIAGNSTANLIDAQRCQISETALITDREPCPLGVVHLSLDSADRREAGCAQKVEYQEAVTCQRRHLCLEICPDFFAGFGYFSAVFIQDTKCSDDILFCDQTGNGRQGDFYKFFHIIKLFYMFYLCVSG